MNAPFAWPGGKRALRKVLLQLQPDHTIYVEVFCGSAKLLFAKEPSKYEVMNDLNGDVANFFRVAKHRPAELAERLEMECVHGATFKELRGRADLACEVDRALRFIYLTWHSFGAKGEHFASGNAKSPRAKHPLDQVRTLLKSTAARLARVLIEQRDFEEILGRYDRRDTFFYLDPPYVHFESNGRYAPFSAEQLERLFFRLGKVRGKFLLSFDDCDEVRTLASRRKFRARPVDVTYTLAGSAPRRSSPELLISNYL